MTCQMLLVFWIGQQGFVFSTFIHKRLKWALVQMERDIPFDLANT